MKKLVRKQTKDSFFTIIFLKIKEVSFLRKFFKFLKNDFLFEFFSFQHFYLSAFFFVLVSLELYRIFTMSPYGSGSLLVPKS